MPRFKQYYISEKYKNSFEVRTPGGKRILVDVFENPNRKEIQELFKLVEPSKAMRMGVTDKGRPTVFAWRVDILHDDMGKHLKFDIPVLWNANEFFQFRVFDQARFTKWDKVKNKKGFLKALQKLSPKAKYLLVVTDTPFDEKVIDIKTGEEVDREEVGI